MPILVFEHIIFRYDDAEPLLFDRFSLTVQPGEKVGIKAESGRGKTTLLRLALGFIQPGAGEIRFNRQEISSDRYSGIRQSSAWLPQNLNLGEGSVNELIHRIFEFEHNRPAKPTEEELQATLGRLGLSPDLPDSPFNALSTGQQQRVGLALCHLLNRPLILLDEPTSALDRVSKQRARDLILDTPGQTVLSATHDPYWLERCDRVVELDPITESNRLNP